MVAFFKFQKFISRPVCVEAAEIVEVKSYNESEGCFVVEVKECGGKTLWVTGVNAYKGDFVILERKGEKIEGYVCERSIFLMKYQPENELLE